MSSKLVPYWDKFCSVHRVHLRANVYNEKSTLFQCSTATAFHIKGSKGLFWKHTLSDVTGYDYIWLLDEDMRFYDPSFGVLSLVMDATKASILQPSVIPVNHNKFVNYSHPKNDCMVHTTSFVEVQAPVFAANAWTSFYKTILSNIPDPTLYKSCWVDAFWCTFVEKRLHSRCVYSKLTLLKHLSLKTMNKKRRQHMMRYSALPETLKQYIRYPSRPERVRGCLDSDVERHAAGGGPLLRSYSKSHACMPDPSSRHRPELCL